MRKVEAFTAIKGMNRDLAASKFSPEFAYEIRNMRLMPDRENTFMALVNEKGTKRLILKVGTWTNDTDEVEYKDGETLDRLDGVPIGTAVIGDTLVVFTHKDGDDKPDRIYKIKKDGDGFVADELYNGNQDFDARHPLETIVYYENSDLQKVYWVDGINQPRVINIAATQEYRSRWAENRFDDSFNSVRAVALNESMTIERLEIANGSFHSGVIQYVFTYFDKYMQETNPFYTSALYYISFSNRGGSPEENVSTGFRITITNVDTRFDYIRIYSILRTSLDGEPTCRIVANVDTASTVQYTDTGTAGEDIDPADMFYIGGEDIIAGTMEQKDNTLFFGNIKLNSVPFYKIDGVKDYFQGTFANNVKFGTSHLSADGRTVYVKTIDGPEAKGTYQYKNILNHNSRNVSTFKYRDTYRLGIQAQYKTGKWSDVVWVCDLKNNACVEHADNGRIYTPYPAVNIGGSGDSAGQKVIENLVANGYVRLRPVIAKRNDSDKDCVCQGVLCPTVYNVNDRAENAPFAQSSWFTRPVAGTNASLSHNPGVSDKSSSEYASGAYLENRYHSNSPITITGTYSRESTDDDGNPELDDDGNPESITVIKYPNNTDKGVGDKSLYTTESYNIYHGTPLEFRHNYPIPNCYNRNCEIQCINLANPSPRLRTDILSEMVTILGGTTTTTDYGYAQQNVVPCLYSDNSSGAWMMPATITATEYTEGRQRWIDAFRDNYFIDQSIVTLHSPDIEFSESIKHLDTDSLKLRIIGAAPLTSFSSNIDIQTSTPALTYSGEAIVAQGFYKYPVGTNYSVSNGYKALVGGPMWVDTDTSSKTDSEGGANTHVYAVYPWHRNGSMNNQAASDSNGYRSAMLEQKKMMNEHVSYRSLYLSSPFEFETTVDAGNGDVVTGGISGVAIFDSDEQTMVRLPAPANTSMPEINYYGNIDKVIFPARVTDMYIPSGGWNTQGNAENSRHNKAFAVGPVWMEEAYNRIRHDGSITYEETIYFRTSGYPITESYDDNTSNVGADIPYNYAQQCTYVEFLSTTDNTNYRWSSTDPVRMKYKSTPHAVMALNAVLRHLPAYSAAYYGVGSDYNTTFSHAASWRHATNTLPYYGTTVDGSTVNRWDVNEPISSVMSTFATFFFWDEDGNYMQQDALQYHDDTYRDVKKDPAGYIAGSEVVRAGTILESQFKSENSPVSTTTNDIKNGAGFLWLGELYRDIDDDTRFGGTSNEAMSNVTWIDGGPVVAIADSSGKAVTDAIFFRWTQGDTYYMRYDHIKTYPYTNEDQNSILDIVSFMCESRVNLDGRYDKNRGQVSNLALSPENFNKMNDVYSQQNDFFTFSTINPDRLDLDVFKNTVTWTKTKTAGELVDTWVNITVASTFDLDGDKGPVTALKRIDNDIIVFQDSGVSQLLYNETMQMTSTEGVPVEIANSGKVQGKRYLSNDVGCLNKWSIAQTAAGLYFIDDYNRILYFFNGQFTKMSEQFGFTSWLNSNLVDMVEWNPVDFGNFTALHDEYNQDVLFVNGNDCLAYSESLGQFTAFFDYQGTPYFANLNEDGIWIRSDGTLWLHNAGKYNSFFDLDAENPTYMPYWLTVVANQDMQLDKIFDNIEFRADTYDGEDLLHKSTFDTLRVWNEYQDTGDVSLSHIIDKPSSVSNIKKKFRIWRAVVPRDRKDGRGRNRIRNPWVYITLKMDDPRDCRTIMHDLMVYYFDSTRQQPQESAEQ